MFCNDRKFYTIHRYSLRTKLMKIVRVSIFIAMILLPISKMKLRSGWKAELSFQDDCLRYTHFLVEEMRSVVWDQEFCVVAFTGLLHHCPSFACVQSPQTERTDPSLFLKWHSSPCPVPVQHIMIASFSATLHPLPIWHPQHWGYVKHGAHGLVRHCMPPQELLSVHSL